MMETESLSTLITLPELRHNGKEAHQQQHQQQPQQQQQQQRS
jgi:hypothetical protein